MKKNADTLTELVAVITIIGLVILITIPVTKNMIRKNKEEKCTTYVALVENALKTYADMELSKNASTTVTLKNLIDNEYISNIDMLKGNPINYSFSISSSNGKITIPAVKLTFTISNEDYCCDNTYCNKNACS